MFQFQCSSNKALNCISYSPSVIRSKLFGPGGDFNNFTVNRIYCIIYLFIRLNIEKSKNNTRMLFLELVIVVYNQKIY